MIAADGMLNWWWLTQSPLTPSAPALKLDRGISGPAQTARPDGWQAVILLRSSPHKAGSEITPWEDLIRPDEGYVRYFGDNRVGTGRPAHGTEGNARMLAALDQHLSGDIEVRRSAPPILILEGFGHEGRPKGQVRFQGLAVLQRSELLVQRDPQSGGSFTNYRFDLVLLDLKDDEDELDWRWIDDRRDSTIAAAEAIRKAPVAWREWVTQDQPALERLQRRVLKRRVMQPASQRPVQGSSRSPCSQACTGTTTTGESPPGVG